MSGAGLFRCPHCGEPLEPGERVWRCPRGHSFDVARQGYVALERKPARGDTAEMIAARVAFLEAGHYDPIADALVQLAREVAAQPLTVADLGAGTGFYLAHVLDAFPAARGLALDSSRPALRRAAKAHPRISAVACDIWDALPLQDHAADLILNVFAPRNAPEFRRVLAPGGAALIVTPTERHLAELDLLAIHPGKRERIHADLSEPVLATHVEFVMDLDADAVAALVGMGPAAHHGRVAPGARRVTASVMVEAFRG